MAFSCTSRARSAIARQAAAPRSACVVRVLRPSSEPHIQLGTAKLPGDVNPTAFAEYMYQWAATLTQSGANFPFVLPVKADKYDMGFKISLLKKMPAGNFDSAGEIQGTVEEVAGKGSVCMIRFFEGPAGMADRRTPAPAEPLQRLDVVIQSLPDVDTIMSTMPVALRNGVAKCR